MDVRGLRIVGEIRGSEVQLSMPGTWTPSHKAALAAVYGLAPMWEKDRTGRDRAGRIELQKNEKEEHARLAREARVVDMRTWLKVRGAKGAGAKGVSTFWATTEQRTAL